jgi:RecA-family ATPase/5S rRNA maturation endonuclease (ribonuclease M5)
VAIDFEELKREDCRTVARRLGLDLNRQDKVRCFLHAGDKNPSLQIYADGWKCFGCGEHGDAVDLVSKYLGISNTEAVEWMKKEFNIQEPPRKQDYGQAEREHIYPGGQVKKVMYRRTDGSKYGIWFHLENGAWKKGRGNAPHSLYIAGQLTGAVFVVEGEKDCDTLHKLGYDAVSGEDGAGPGKWRPEYTEQLKGLSVVIFQDNDQTGKDYAQETAAAIHGVASSVQVLDLTQVWTNMPEKGDISDLVAKFGAEKSCDMIAKLISTTPQWEPPPSEADPLLSLFKSLEDFPEEDAKWLIPGWIPAGQISVIAADGGIGKTTLWCHIIAALSNGTTCILDPPGYTREPMKIMFLTTEDSVRKKLRKKLRLAGANMKNIITPDFVGDRSGMLHKLKFGSEELERVLRYFRPALCVFDPIQGFTPPRVNMGSRNEMRDCTAQLITIGEDINTTALIVCHTNKRKGACGRDRIADSADIWDIARSVLMAGFTEDQGVRYLSNEKNNYAQLQETVLFSIDSDEQIHKEGTSWRRDREYVMGAEQAKSSPMREDCKAFIMKTLHETGGAMPTADLDELITAAGYSFSSLKRAKADLKREGNVRYFHTGSNDRRVWHIQALTDLTSNFEELREDIPTPFDSAPPSDISKVV